MMQTFVIFVIITVIVAATLFSLIISSDSDHNNKSYNKNPYECTTNNNEHVKSHGEKDIADFLQYNGIQYIYEDRYPYERNYHPDFHIVGTKIWIEYFGIDRNGKVPSFMGSSEEYRKGIAWKRSTHTRHRTILISLYSYERQEGTLLVHLRNALYRYGIQSKIPYYAHTNYSPHVNEFRYDENFVYEEVIIDERGIPDISEITDYRPNNDRSVMDMIMPYSRELKNGFIQIRYEDVIINLSPEQQQKLSEIIIPADSLESDFSIDTGLPKLDTVIKKIIQ